MEIRTRIAPSPTGMLHIGTARTALFNYLFAKSNGGKFILRFEDTDQARSTKESEADILDGLLWLGLNWDEGVQPDGTYKGSCGPYHQFERLDIYQKYIDQLLKQGMAYEKDGAVYFKTPPGKCEFDDLVKGKISFENDSFGDFVIRRGDGTPTFILANAIDDIEMQISHIIRGEDIISTTPKQILIIQALGFKLPFYAHLPLTLNPDRSKLSKRFGAVSVLEYREEGFLPEALINFIVFLGWNPKTTEEFFTIDELIQKFNIKDVGRSAAIFNIEKLHFYNNHYLQKLSLDNLAFRCLPYLIEKGLVKEEEVKQKSGFILKLVTIFRERLHKLSDITTLSGFIFKLPDYDSRILIFKKSDKEKTLQGLSAAQKSLELLSEKDWENQDKLNDALLKVVEKEKLDNGSVFWPVRVALSGLEKTPSPAELLWVLGKEESLKRLKKAIIKLTKL